MRAMVAQRPPLPECRSSACLAFLRERNASGLSTRFVRWLIGSAVSALNFRWLKQLTQALGSGTAKPRTAVFLGMRYLLLGGGAYVILKYSAISLPAALSGLFVSVAAVVLEILLELAYARNGTVDH